MDNFISKKELRKQILSIRKAMDNDMVIEKSKLICDRIINHIASMNIDNICLYSPIQNEVDLFYLEDYLDDNNINIWLPKILDNEMDFYEYDGKENLRKGYFDILEPISDKKLSPTNSTIIVMPGSVFTKEKDRIGYGGGFYDKYLSKQKDVLTIAVGYDFQLVESIPTEEHDIKPNCIITDIQTII